MMKNKRILYILVVLMLIFSVMTINALAYGTGKYETVAHHYFEELQGNIPENCHGSCGYISMAMLLSFYDIYWNDEFVNEEYTTDNGAKSGSWRDFPIGAPGLKLESEELTDSEREDETLYRQFIQTYAKDYLHMYLLSLGTEMNLCNESNNTGSFETTFRDMAIILDRYFDFVFGDADYYEENEDYDSNLPLTIHYIYEFDSGQNRQSVLEKIKEQVNSGNPVIYRGDKLKTSNTNDSSEFKGSNKVGHCMIAYHAENDGNILLHTGHVENPETTINKTEYNLNIGVLWIEINEDVLSHVCSQNYEYNNSGNYIKVCSCIAYKYVHPEHDHKDVRLTPLNSAKHIYKCIYGCEIEKDHNLIHKSDDGYHSLVCECGYSREEHYTTIYQEAKDFHIIIYECESSYERSHNITYSQSSDTRHECMCECGYSFNENHIYEYTMLIGSRHLKKCRCGYSIEESHEYEYQQISNQNHSIVCKCGYRYEKEHIPLYWQQSISHHSFLCKCGYISASEQHNLVQQDYHTSVCDVCGYIETTPHSSSYQQLSDTHHLVSCGCGYEGEAPHNFTCVSTSSSLHRLTCVCGYTTLEAHNFTQTSNPRYYSCTKCGYTRDNFGPGGNIQMGIKKEEETE